ncbi:RNA polymerase subunit sigma-70 [Pleomorphochaeta sp. DL1XJH-081]|jgi:endogenous inhibitor of DNA gyrase (YacG/DUF329 family)|uniref:RNA polymerase subunit sigma-70 n=1 Tax=Pleomorphochaeta sp. DL1XJH-081 TaxID=3409690 RepID=UPI003BB7ED24
MTEPQKRQIQEMRQLGWNYKRIATTLCLPEGTVKSYCIRTTRKGILPAIVPTQESSCKQCGIHIEQVPKRKRKTFCSKACSQKWWNTHLYLVDRSSKALHHFTCPTCGKRYSVYGNADRKYCSHECYINARYYQGPSDGQ